MSKTYFEFFGFEESLNIDIKELQKRYYALSRELHPDFHQSGTGAELAQSLESSSFLNQAFLTLKDNEKRMHYLCSLHLGELSESEKKQTPPELLMALMDIQEQLDFYKSNKTPEQLIELNRSLEYLREIQLKHDEEIKQKATLYEIEKDSVAKTKILSDIRLELLKKNFSRSLINTIETELNHENI